jgi:acyl-CoA synthetase (AMP-forming)/AMP-acid ligase II
VYDDTAGELPKAYVVKSPSVGKASSDQLIIQDIQRYVEQHKAKYKWLRGGVEFIDVIPKSPSGKILRRLLRDKERKANRKSGPRL